MYFFFVFMDNPLCLISTDSTNDEAFKLALNGAEHGFGVLAATQLAGKGRLGKSWVSPAGTGIYCSIVLRPALPFTEFPRITLTAGLALCKAIEGLFPHVPFGLKWPNDLYSKGKKCGGILVESSSPSSSDGNSFIIVGIGVNVNTPAKVFSSELKKKATSLRILSGHDFDIRKLYYRIHRSVLDYMDVHTSSGFDEILKEWRKRDVLLGKEMQWVTCDKKLITARGMGPDANGRLLARDSSGRIHEILSGDVQLADKI